MNRLNKFLVFALVLFIGLGVACAAGVDDASVDDATGSSPVSEVVSETSMENGNLPVEDDVGDNTDPGANPTPYTSISETTYENAAIKNLKKEDETIIITEDNIGEYGEISYNQMFLRSNIPSNSNVIVYVPSDVYQLTTNINDKTIRIQAISDSLTRWISQTTIVNSYLPGTRIQTTKSVVLINSTFLDTNANGPDTKPERWTIENSTILSYHNNVKVMDYDTYDNFFDSTTNILLDSFEEGNTLAIRLFVSTYKFYKPIIINKPINLTCYIPSPFDADITFVAGSEGSNLTGLTLNGNLYINTSNINVKNTTINKGVFVNGGSGVVIEENTFNTDETAVVLSGAVETAIQNNNITTTSEYTITLDADSVENTITGNNLQAATLMGVASVHDEGEDNTITDGGDEPVVVEPELRIDTTEFTVGSPATITASIYKGDEVDSTITKGKVVFKVNGKTLKDANGKVIYAKVTDGVATITDYEVPSSWAKDNVTIQAVYSGSSQCDALRAEANLTVTKDAPAITTSDIQASKGETVTLTATVAAGNTPVNVGKVVFKVNGKTVKDSNGKVIYASVVNGQVSVNYTVPENMKAGSYNITVSFTAPGYEKLTDTKTLIVSG